MADVVAASAPAKVNLVLEVTGTRSDGYHEIDTVMQTLELADDVRLCWGCTPGVQATGPWATGVPLDTGNLAWRAAAGLADACGQSVADLQIELLKRIPAAGGLGGGASDAATVLRVLGHAWRVREADLLKVANDIGSDEAFFLTGGTARARGRGETVTPLPPIEPHDVVLFVPPRTIERKTARMFAALDRHPFDDGGVSEAFAQGERTRFGSADVYNSFEKVAFDLFPELAKLWEDLEWRVGEAVRLAGAGPTLFWIGPAGGGEGVAALAEGSACTVIPTRTPGR